LEEENMEEENNQESTTTPSKVQATVTRSGHVSKLASKVTASTS